MLRNSSRSTVPIMNGRAAGLPAAPGCINMALCERYAPAVAAAAADVTGAGPAAATTEPDVGFPLAAPLPPRLQAAAAALCGTRV